MATSHPPSPIQALSKRYNPRLVKYAYTLKLTKYPAEVSISLSLKPHSLLFHKERADLRWWVPPVPGFTRQKAFKTPLLTHERRIDHLVREVSHLTCYETYTSSRSYSVLDSSFRSFLAAFLLGG